MFTKFRFYYFFIALLVFSCQPRNIIKSFDELVEKPKASGLVEYYDKQGNLFTGNIHNENISGDFLNGRKIGLWKWYYTKGKLRSKGEYNKQGNKTGLWLLYNENGNLVKESIYENGKLIQGEDIEIKD